MSFETEYRDAYQKIKEIKKEYFRNALEEYNRKLLKKVDDNSWSRQERHEAYLANVLPYWEQFGYVPEPFWFELNGSRNRQMDPYLIPSDLYYNELLPYLNNLPFRYALQDKCYLDMKFPDVLQAVTVIRRIADTYYDPQMHVITEAEAAALCGQRKTDLFIKPSLYTGSGEGIRRFSPSGLKTGELLSLFEKTGANFIVQEKIKQHASLAELNPCSVCTIRILSLFWEGEVSIPHSMIRVGLPGSAFVSDQGGYSAEILPDGHLHPKAFRDEENWIDAEEEGLYDNSFLIPEMDQIRNIVRRLHPRLGHFKWIGWDFTLNEEGEALLIEFNTAPGDDVQRVCGRSLFGEQTDRVLQDFFFHRSLENNQLKNCRCFCDEIRRYL